MTRKIIGNACFVLGFLSIALSACLLVYDYHLECTAANASEGALLVLQDEIVAHIETQPNTAPDADFDPLREEAINIDGHSYSAVLTLPSIGLTLPVQSNWSYENLAQTPCFYSTAPLVIAAHNYPVHFGALGTLAVGDAATLTFISGIAQTFTVGSVGIIDETDVEVVSQTTNDLTLFTCDSPNDSQRVVVALNAVDAE